MREGKWGAQKFQVLRQKENYSAPGFAGYRRFPYNTPLFNIQQVYHKYAGDQVVSTIY
jgi:hypothetical protein